VIHHRHEVIVAVVLIVAAARGLSAPPGAGLDHWQRTEKAPETLVPDLEKDGRLRLSWLPGVGSYRADRIVRERPLLQLPLTPQRLELVPGVGETTAKAVEDWYRRQAQAP